VTKLILHELTDQQVQRFIEAPSHALLLHGPAGSGKRALAESIAQSILGLDDDQLVVYPYLLRVNAADISSEAIETVRKLEKFLSLRVPSVGSVNRIIIMSDAQELSAQAQNALLKTIEEPPQGTLIILTAYKIAGVLPTISSRLQAIAVKKPKVTSLSAHFLEKGQSEADIKQAAAITGGLPGIMTALLSDEDHPLKKATQLTRQLLQGSIYERFLMAESLVKDKPALRDVLFILQQMAHSKLLTTSGDQFRRWQLILTSAYDATRQLNLNAQPKLVVDSLLLKLN
jgi:DNA polymerase-3 subunit delta'